MARLKILEKALIRTNMFDTYNSPVVCKTSYELTAYRSV